MNEEIEKEYQETGTKFFLLNSALDLMALGYFRVSETDFDEEVKQRALLGAETTMSYFKTQAKEVLKTVNAQRELLGMKLLSDDYINAGNEFTEEVIQGIFTLNG